jgi:hypothetical protein
MFAAQIANRPEPVTNGHLLIQWDVVTQQIMGPGKDLQSLFRRMPFDRSYRRSKSQMKAQFGAVSLGSRRQFSDKPYPVRQVLCGLGGGGLPKSEFSCLAPVFDRRIDETCPCVVMR